MNYSVFLHSLHDQLSTPNDGTNRQIIRFTNRAACRRCMAQAKKLLPHLPNLAQLKWLKIINAFSCSLLPHSIPNAGGIPMRLEQDSKIKVHTQAQDAGHLNIQKSLPWGIRHIHAPQVWSKSMGNKIKIAVIDTGVDYQHPDLRASLSHGVNLIHRSMLPYDDNGHGTHIAGIIAASSYHSGYVGVAPQASIHAVKAFDHNGTAHISDIVRGIDWSVQNGIDIINMSFGMKDSSMALQEAVRNAHQAGVIIVASSGNDAKQGFIDYPARYAQTIAVGAIDKNGKIAHFSNRGKRIDIYAPGERIPSTWLKGKYKEMSGTSMATSHVSGVIALLLAAMPQLQPTEVKRMIIRSAVPLKDNKKPSVVGHINAARIFRRLLATDQLVSKISSKRAR